MVFLYDNTIGEGEVERALQEIKEWFGRTPVKRVFRKNLKDFREGETLFVLAPDGELKVWLNQLRQRRLQLYILPYSGNRLAQSFFALPESPRALFEAGNFTQWLTLFNGEVLLDRVVVMEEEWSQEKGVWHGLLKNLSHLHLFRTTLRVGDQRITTALLMAEGGSEIALARRYPLFREVSCDRVALIAHAPLSLLDLIPFQLALRKGGELPRGVGIVRSREIKMESEKGLCALVDGERRSLEGRLSLRTVQTRLQIATGPRECRQSGRDSIKIDTLPREEELIEFYTKRRLPLFPIASEERFAELFTKIRQNARLDLTYLTLLVISVLMATIGLFQNSAPTIIGAMILAPLMAPIISLAMGIVRLDPPLIGGSLKTLLVSIATVLALSALVAFSMPSHHLTPQMALRTNPTLLDLGVAILSGIAAAYGYANSRVGESLAGVAIAVALVPPLSVAGIGLGWGDGEIFRSAFLLFGANIIGIIFAAGVMFYILGFASQKYVTAAFMIKVALLSTIVIPLYISTRTYFLYERLYDQIMELERGDLSIRIQSIYRRGEETYIDLQIIAPKREMAQKVITELRNRFRGYRFVVSYRELL
ncbi:MAG: TIGR00341 family protein [Epsilonproteobacteria bacterium]|nr:TIGR00341 family protein [Campylobacterota bacterium]NPA57369.1 TIGR00341 family protein [Campylobacterota bacterium]